MPYGEERSSATGAFDILTDPTVRAFMSTARTHVDLAPRRGLIQGRIRDVSRLVREVADGCILASDASPYEAVARRDFPSVRVGLIKFSNVTIQVRDYKRLRGRRELFVDPVEIAAIRRAATSLSMAVPGAGITTEDEPRSKALFRRTVFDEFRSERFTSCGESLLDTFVDLLRRGGSVVVDGGREGIYFKAGKKSPIDGRPLPAQAFVPLDPGHADLDGGRLYLTDALRVQDTFVEEGANVECLSRLMSAMEHVLVAHFVRCAHKFDRQVTGNLSVIVDGPLAIFGEASRFHRGIMNLLDDVRRECRALGMPGPLVIGVSKTGKVVEHAQMIDAFLQMEDDGVTPRVGTFVLPVDDEYRYGTIQPNSAPAPGGADNFGDDTYYGQTFIVRTSRRKVFDITLAYPFRSKSDVAGVPFREAKMDLARYGDDLGRMLSLVEMMQTDLFENALIPIHLAHRYASIAHAPAGKTLDSFVREALKASGANL